MAQKQKVYDDPLSLFSDSSTASASNTTYATVSPVDSGDIASINIDKITFKTKTKKSSQPNKETDAKSSINLPSTTAAASGSAAFTQLPIDFGGLKSDVNDAIPVNDFLTTSGGLFTNESAKGGGKNEDDLFNIMSSVSPSNKTQVLPSSVRVVANENDDNFADLSVGRILEREELDFDMFGKSDIRQSANGAPQPPKSSTAGNGRREDLSVVSGDVLSDFDSIFSPPAVTSKPKKQAAKSAVDESAPPSMLVDSDALDIDSYINSQFQDESSASLFG